MVAAPIDHIALDDAGIAYVRGTRIKVADIVVDAETWGRTPREILESYPRLSLAQVHAALSYYYDHRDEVDAYLARELEEYEQLRAAIPNRITREELEQRQHQEARRAGAG